MNRYLVEASDGQYSYRLYCILTPELNFWLLTIYGVMTGKSTLHKSLRCPFRFNIQLGSMILPLKNCWRLQKYIYTNILKGVCDNVYMPRDTSVTPLKLSNVYINRVN